MLVAAIKRETAACNGASEVSDKDKQGRNRQTMVIYANIARSFFAHPKRLYTRLQRDDVWLEFLPLAIVLVNGLKPGGHISSLCQLVGQGHYTLTYCNCAVFSLLSIFRTSECVIWWVYVSAPWSPRKGPAIAAYRAAPTAKSVSWALASRIL